jgi:hypothetical protein
MSGYTIEKFDSPKDDDDSSDRAQTETPKFPSETEKYVTVSAEYLMEMEVEECPEEVKHYSRVILPWKKKK